VSYIQERYRAWQNLQAEIEKVKTVPAGIKIAERQSTIESSIASAASQNIEDIGIKLELAIECNDFDLVISALSDFRRAYKKAA